MTRAILTACLLAIGVKATFAVATFAQDQHAARRYVLSQGVR